MCDLNPVVRKRVYALKNLQKGTIELDAQFHRDVYELERKFQGKHDEIFKKRSDIVNGLYEPTDDECKSSDVELIKDVPAEGQENQDGVPNFWLYVLKNVTEVNSMIEIHDEPVLKHLIDVRAFSKASPDLSFQLEFHFEPNEYFQNSILTKTYLMKCAPDDDDPFSFEGPEIYKSIGCEIMWNTGMNVTEKAIKKRDSTLKIFKADSFFNFFNPPELKVENDDNEKIEVSCKLMYVIQYHLLTSQFKFTQEYLENDFEVGHYLKERVIPRAVLYFTGEIEDDISDDDDDSDNFQAENFDLGENEINEIIDENICK